MSNEVKTDPKDVLRARALAHLNEQLDRETRAVTGRPIRWAALQIGLLVAVVYMSTYTQGALAIAPDALVTGIGIALAIGIVSCLSLTLKQGQRMQKAYQAKVTALTNGSLSPTEVLNTRLTDLRRISQPVLEPKDVVAAQLREAQEAHADVKTLQANLDLAAIHAVHAPALADSVVAKAEPRRIALSIN